MKRTILATIIIAFASNAYTQSMNLSTSDRDNLMKTHNTITMTAHENPQALDWNVFVKAHYADDAILMPPNAPIAEGQAAIVATFKSWPALTKFQTNDVEVVGSGNLAFIRGTYDIAFQMNGADVTDSGKYIEVWRKNDKGEWKCIRDIFNSNAPASH